MKTPTPSSRDFPSLRTRLRNYPHTHKIAALIVLALIILRIVAVPTLQGFHYDELARQSVVENYLNNGEIQHTNYAVASIPFYIAADADWSPWPTFYAPAIVWASIFGSSQLSLRFFAEFTMLAAILLFAWGFSLWFRRAKNRHQQTRAFLLFAIIGLSVPWLFIQGMVFWNPTLVPLYFAISFLGFSLLANPRTSNSQKTKKLHTKILQAALAIFGLICVAYTYKPPIVPAAILAIIMIIYWWIRRTLPRPAIIGIVIAAAIAIIPFVLFYFTYDGANTRTAAMSIFSLGPLEMVVAFCRNLLSILNPIFLFFYGDINRRHNLVIFGVLGPALIIPVAYTIIAAIKKQLATHEKTLVIIATLTIALTYIGTASTNEGMPHALRPVSAALPFCIIAAIGALRIADSPNRKLKITTIIIGLISIAAYFLYYFLIYAPTSGSAFS